MTIPAFQEPIPTVYQILATLSRGAKTYLGIGVQEGGCVAHVVRANPAIHLTLCDTWGSTNGGTGRGSHAHIQALLKELGHTGEVEFLDGRSQDLLPHVLSNYDLTYVDGDHDTDPAFDDLWNAWVRTTRAMVVHDTHFPSVHRAYRLWADVIKPRHVLDSDDGTGTKVILR